MTTDGLGCLLLARVVRPSYEFLQSYRTSGLYRHAKQEFGNELFDKVRQAGLARGMIPSHLSTAENCLVKVAFRTGRDLDRLTAEHLIAYHEWSRRAFAKAPAGLHAAWDLMCDVGLLSAALPLRRTVARGQLSTAAMVDRYSIQCRPVRDVLVRYLEERRPSLDYTSLQHLASRLVGAFWADIEKHHPGIDTLDLPAEVAEAWKERIRFITREGKEPIPRQTRTAVLTGVRAFYLDIQQWALEDPSWAAWAVPSPVRKADTGGFTKVKKKVRAKMHQRVRGRLPRLPELVDTTEAHHSTQKKLLAAAQVATVGGPDSASSYGPRAAPARQRPGWAVDAGGSTVMGDQIEFSELDPGGELVARVAALDIAEASAMVCTRVPGGRVRKRQEIRKTGATTGAILELADHLVCQGIELVVMESTSDYWRPFYYLLEDRGLSCWLVNARSVRNVPGRPKTDKLDAVWLAKLADRGMLRRSFVPPAPVRGLRDLTRARAVLTADRTAFKDRVEKVLEDAQIKLSCVASDIFGVSGRAMLQALIAGERNPRDLAGLARGRLQAKHEDLRDALRGASMPTMAT